MNSRKRSKRKKKSGKLWIGAAALLGVAVIAAAAFGIRHWMRERGWKQPDELLQEYMAYIPEREYGRMYAMLDAQTALEKGEEELESER